MPPSLSLSSLSKELGRRQIFNATHLNRAQSTEHGPAHNTAPSTGSALENSCLTQINLQDVHKLYTAAKNRVPHSQSHIPTLQLFTINPNAELNHAEPDSNRQFKSTVAEV